MMKRFWHTKAKESESLMLEKTMSTDCPQSVSCEKVSL